MGTNKGEKLNEPESDPSPICKKKKWPEPGPNGLSVSGPVGFRRACRPLFLISRIAIVTSRNLIPDIKN